MSCDILAGQGKCEFCVWLGKSVEVSLQWVDAMSGPENNLLLSPAPLTANPVTPD
jgi:hypothetical protein